MNYGKLSVQIREQTGGQIFTGIKVALETKDDLSIHYTPGIAEPCREITKNPELARKLTVKKNLVAVISDGSAVLGLGNIGPEAALPVMEGKSMLFKQFGDVDAIPIVLDTQNSAEIIETIKNIAPTLGGINLEDISAPRCFEIEEKLIEMLNIPVFHDDQHGTAICCLAALKNALKVVDKKKEDIKVVISGAGAAGIAIAKLLKEWGVKNLVLIDSKGIVSKSRENLHKTKQLFAIGEEGGLAEAMVNADVFVGVSKPNVLTSEMIKTMNVDSIVFAMSNPDPEVLPGIAKTAGVKIMATGRSDFPNQINNVLVFPGLFRGILNGGIRKITTEIKLIAAETLADLVKNPNVENIIPSPLDKSVAPAIAAMIQHVK